FPGEEIGKLGAQPDAALARQALRLLERDRREVDGESVEPALGEKDAIAPLAVGNAQHAVAATQARGLGSEEGIGRGAEEIRLAGEAFVPAGAPRFVCHGRPPSSAASPARPPPRGAARAAIAASAAACRGADPYPA